MFTPRKIPFLVTALQPEHLQKFILFQLFAGKFSINIISKVPPLIMKDAETLRTQSNISKMDFRGEIDNDL